MWLTSILFTLLSLAFSTITNEWPVNTKLFPLSLFHLFPPTTHGIWHQKPPRNPFSLCFCNTVKSINHQVFVEWLLILNLSYYVPSTLFLLQLSTEVSWVISIDSLSFSFLICEMGIIISSLSVVKRIKREKMYERTYDWAWNMGFFPLLLLWSDN